eukprot:12424277-Karenia_brevis.AAC.1
MGILRFEDADHKASFKQALRESKYSTSFKERALYIDENHPKEDRPKRRAVGKVKRALMEKQPGRSDVIAWRDKGEVWIGTQR